MRKSLEKVLTGEANKCGNYRRVDTYTTEVGSTTEIYLYTTVIGGYNSNLDIFFADTRGFDSVTTTRAVNSIKEYYKNASEVTVDEFKEITGAECEVGYWKN